MKFAMAFLTLVFLSACSVSSDSPAPPPLLGPNNFKKTIRPLNVPAVAGEYTYFGLQPLVLDEAIDFTLFTGFGKQIVDFELRADQRLNLNLAQFEPIYDGECTKNRDVSWLIVDESGRVLSRQSLKLFETFVAYPKERHLLRITYETGNDCLTIYSTLKIETF